MKHVVIENDSEINDIMSNINYDKFLIQLSATWCPPCVRITPQVKQFVEEINDPKAVYMYCDVDKCPGIYAYIKPNGIPAFISIVKNNNNLFDVEKMSSSSIIDIMQFCKYTGIINASSVMVQ